MRTNKIVLSKREAQWFGENILRMIERLDKLAQTDAEVTKRAAYKVMMSMKTKAEQTVAVHRAFSELHDYEVDVILNPKQRRYMEGLVGTVQQGLQYRVIPKYEQGIKDGKKELQDYLDRAQVKSQMLLNLQRKFK